MSLRAQAEADLGVTLEAPGDFGAAVTLTDPAGFTAGPLFGRTADIGLLLDPDTGQGVSGRHVTLTLRKSTLVALGYTGFPEAIAPKTSPPWLAEIADSAGNLQTFKIKASFPDRTFGLVVCVLEFWNPAP